VQFPWKCSQQESSVSSSAIFSHVVIPNMSISALHLNIIIIIIDDDDDDDC